MATVGGWTATCDCGAGCCSGCAGAGPPSRLRGAGGWRLRTMRACACRTQPCTRTCMCCHAALGVASCWVICVSTASGAGRAAGGTLVARTTRTVLLVPLTAKDAMSVRRAFARRIKTVPRQMRLSLTHDRGKEMAEHRLFTRHTQIQVYFAHPQRPWERGTNENTNGLIRQFFPKGTDFGQVSHYQIQRVQQLLNGRPRKVLNWKTPFETFNERLH